MPRTAIVAQQIDFDGLTASYTAASVANGHEFLNTGDQFVHVVNAGGGATVITISTPKTIHGLTIQDPTISVGAGAEAFIGPFPPTAYNQTGGLVYLDLDVDTTVTLAVLKL